MSLWFILFIIPIILLGINGVVAFFKSARDGDKQEEMSAMEVIILTCASVMARVFFDALEIAEGMNAPTILCLIGAYVPVVVYVVLRIRKKKK